MAKHCVRMTDSRFVGFDNAVRLKQDRAIRLASRIEHLQCNKRQRMGPLAEYFLNVDYINCHCSSAE
ncbi:hypothetical protein WL32_21645 [Burkholderia cepacia]|nr:hypothetical protein WL32_21645 [Burkholderia cepacia]